MSILSRSAGPVLVFGLFCGYANANTAAPFVGTVSVGQQSLPMMVTVTMTRGGVAAAPAVVTQGVAGLDFSAAAGGTCAAGTTYNAGDQCSVAVMFAPKFPGMRTGAIVVQGTNGSLLGQRLISGTGQGSLATLVPGRIDTVAGDGAWVYVQDGVAATAAPIFLPMGLVMDAGGSMFISDSNNQRIRKVDGRTGLISTVAGNGTPGYAGDGGPATQAEISAPSGLALDGAGDLYFVDSGNDAIRRVDATTGVITTIAGMAGSQGYSGDGGPATAARLTLPEGLAIDAAQNLYIGDTGNDAVRMVSFATGTILTIAGTGAPGFNGDNRAAITAQLNAPWGVTVGADGSIYIAESVGQRVRKISLAGTISTVAGTGMGGFAGDAGAATVAQLNTPVAVALDPAGDLYIADSGNNRVRKVSGTTGNIVTITGTNSEQFAGDAGPANLASLYGPYALLVDQAGNLLVADMFHNRVRKISATTVSLGYATIRVGKVSPPQPVTIEDDGNASLTPTAPVLNNAALDVVTTTCTTGTAVAIGATCVLGVEFAPTTVGALVTGSVTAGSDAGNSPVVVNVSGEVLSVDPTAVSVTSSANPSLLGASLTLTATVTGSGTGWTGTVLFFDGTTQICSANLGAGGIASCNVTTLTLGTHSITANYGGDTYDAASTSTALTQVVKQAATLALTVTPNPATVTGNVTMTVTASAAMSTPTGTIVFYDGTTAIGSGVLSGSGVATFSTTQLVPGAHAISGQYAGDTADAAGQSNTVSEVVNQASTVTMLTTSGATVQVGTVVTLTATVTCQSGPAPDGTVQFTSGNTVLGSATVGSNGVATLVLSSLAPGLQNIIATYGGNTDDAVSSSTALVETVQQIGTTTALVPDANPVSALAALHLNATVTMAAGATADGPITGQVTFSDAGVVLGSAAVNSSGVATLEISTLVVGQHMITATYAGNTNYSGSASGLLTETVNLAPTSSTLAGNATVLAGTPYTLTATIAFSAALGSGTVSFLDGGTRIGSGAVNSQGMATLTLTTLAAGSHTILAQYSGDSNYGGSRTVPLTMTVEQDPTTTALSAGPSPAAVGQSVTLTATVTAVSQGFTGSVNFMEGSATVGSAMVGAGGVATFTTTSLNLGLHTIVAVYAGDVNHESSTSSSSPELIVQEVTMLVTASANPSISGTSLIFSAKVAGSTGGSVPTGTVTFTDGGTTIGTGTLDPTGVASFATSTLAVGTHTITASYSGDSHYGSGSAQMTETIQSAGTQITLVASANPATYASSLGLTATIVSLGGAATGTITFTDGGVTVGTGAINANGVATLAVSTLAPGTHNLVANYGGDGKASASVSAVLVVAVKEPTVAVLSSSGSPAQTLAAVTFTAAVTNSGVGVPTGTVTFTEGSTVLGVGTLDGSGHATVTLPQLTAGTHSIIASYAGDGANFATMSAAFNEVVLVRPTTTALSGTSTNANNPLQVTLISVVRWTGTVAPTGTVTFTNGSNVIGTSPLNSTGVASLTIFLSAMTESIEASYSGDVSYGSSDSMATTVTGGPPSQFTLTLSPADMTVASKQHGVVQITATSIKGFTDTLQFGCLGLPFAATCTFSGTSSTLAADGSMVTTLTVDTGDPLGAGAQASNVHGGGAGLMMCLLPGGLLAGVALYRMRRRSGWKARLGTLLAMFAVAVTMGVTGCVSGLQVNGTPAGSYSFKVTASGTGTGATQFEVMNLTVTQ